MLFPEDSSPSTTHYLYNSQLKLQYFGHLMQRPNSLEKNADSWKEWKQKEKGAAEDEMVR